MGNSNSELELNPELPLFFIRLGESWSRVEIGWSGAGLELELMSFFQLRSNSCWFHDLPEKNGKKSIVKTDVHAYGIHDGIKRPTNE